MNDENSVSDQPGTRLNAGLFHGSGTYKTTDADVTTFGVMATFVTSSDVPDDVVYEVTRAVMENVADFRKLHPAFRTLDPKRMIKNGLSAPIHKGAMKYYKEKGLM